MQVKNTDVHGEIPKTMVISVTSMWQICADILDSRQEKRPQIESTHRCGDGHSRQFIIAQIEQRTWANQTPSTICSHYQENVIRHKLIKAMPTDSCSFCLSLKFTEIVLHYLGLQFHASVYQKYHDVKKVLLARSEYLSILQTATKC